MELGSDRYIHKAIGHTTFEISLLLMRAASASRSNCRNEEVAEPSTT